MAKCGVFSFLRMKIFNFHYQNSYHTRLHICNPQKNTYARIHYTENTDTTWAISHIWIGRKSWQCLLDFSYNFEWTFMPPCPCLRPKSSSLFVFCVAHHISVSESVCNPDIRIPRGPQARWLRDTRGGVRKIKSMYPRPFLTPPRNPQQHSDEAGVCCPAKAFHRDVFFIVFAKYRVCQPVFPGNLLFAAKRCVFRSAYYSPLRFDSSLRRALFICSQNLFVSSCPLFPAFCNPGKHNTLSQCGVKPS